MKILVFSLDRSLLDSNSSASKRLAGYSLVADAYHVIVPSAESKTVHLSDSVVIWGTGGKTKFQQLCRLSSLARVLLRGVYYNVLSVQDFHYLGFVAWLLSRVYRVPLEIQVHGFEKFSALRRIVAHFALRQADGIRVVSKRLQEELIQEYTIAPKRISVIPIHVAPPSDVKEKVPHANFVFITASRLVPIKNIELQIAAFADIVKEFPQTRLCIVGDGPERESLEKYGALLGVADTVEFTGWVKDVSTVFAAADAFLLTSYSEGWGMVVIDAAFSNLPIIMTDVGCARELIIPEENGLVIPVNDKEALIVAMKRLITEPKLRERLGSKAYQAVKQLPTIRETLYAYLTAWQKIARP